MILTIPILAGTPDLRQASATDDCRHHWL